MTCCKSHSIAHKLSVTAKIERGALAPCRLNAIIIKSTSHTITHNYTPYHTLSHSITPYHTLSHSITHHNGLLGSVYACEMCLYVCGWESECTGSVCARVTASRDTHLHPDQFACLFCAQWPGVQCSNKRPLRSHASHSKIMTHNSTHSPQQSNNTKNTFLHNSTQFHTLSNNTTTHSSNKTSAH